MQAALGSKQGANRECRGAWRRAPVGAAAYSAGERETSVREPEGAGAEEEGPRRGNQSPCLLFPLGASPWPNQRPASAMPGRMPSPSQPPGAEN